MRTFLVGLVGFIAGGAVVLGIEVWWYGMPEVWLWRKEEEPAEELPPVRVPPDLVGDVPAELRVGATSALLTPRPHQLDRRLIVDDPWSAEAAEELADSPDATGLDVLDPAPVRPLDPAGNQEILDELSDPPALTPPAPRGRKRCPDPQCGALLNANQWATHEHTRGRT